jgi:hypothetical protein
MRRALRYFWHRHIRGYKCEICQWCGRPVHQIWTAPDDMYAGVTGRTDGDGVFCISCFDIEAFRWGEPLRWVPKPLLTPAGDTADTDTT